MIRNLIVSKIQLFLSQDAMWWLIKFSIAVILLFIFYYIISLITTKVQIKIAGDTLHANKYSERISHLVSQMLFIFLMLCAFLLSLEIVGLDTVLILWWITIAIGFAMETTMGNMVAGVMLLTNPKIKVGQTIKLLWSINSIIKIEEFHIRYTVVRTINKQRIIIPNRLLLSTPIQTKQSEELLRGEIKISVARHYDLQMITALLKEIINTTEYVVQTDQTLISIQSFSSKWYDLVCYYFCAPATTHKTDYTLGSIIRQKISQTFAKKDIKFSYPRQTIRVRPTD